MQKNKTRQLVMAALFTALTAVAAQVIIPMAPVPLSFAMVAIYLTGALLDKKYALLSLVTYVLLGVAGAPMFAGFQGGVHKIAGPTGGYIIAYPLMGVVIAYIAERWGRSFWKYTASMTVALLICYTIGTIQLLLVTKADLYSGLMMGVIPFIPLDLVKIVFSAWVATILGKRLSGTKYIVQRS